MRQARSLLVSALASGALWISGCGDNSAAPIAESQGEPASLSATDGDGRTPSPESVPQQSLPTASISGATDSSLPSTATLDTAANQREQQGPPEEGSPRWLVLQMTQLRMQPFPETDDIDAQRAARRDRNLEIVELATQAIAKTHTDPELEAVFNVAVHRLMDATLQLALQGDQDSVDALYGHADTLYQRDPKSRAAAESAWFVARFANENARRFAQQDARWVQEFSRQARSFAERFPQEQQRAVGLLSDAAASCDFHGLREEALQNYAALRENYPDTPQSEQAIPALRRLNLIGKPLDLGGPTLDGGFISVADFKGSPVLVVFWSTQARPFVDQSKVIIETIATYEEQGLQVLGVNLDTDEAAIDSFLESSGLGWRTIFHADANLRGWRNPVANYYGVTSIPQIWLIGADGKVISTSIQPNQLKAALTRLLSPAAKKTEPAAAQQ